MTEEVSAFSFYAKKETEVNKAVGGERKLQNNVDSNKKSNKRKRSSATPIKNEKNSAKKPKSPVSKSPSQGKKNVVKGPQNTKISNGNKESKTISPESLSKSQKKKRKNRKKKELTNNNLEGKEKDKEENGTSQSLVHNKEEIDISYEAIQNGDMSSDETSDEECKIPKVKVKCVKKHKNKIPIATNTDDRIDLFSWVISPVDEFKFRTENWESRPIHIKRHCSDYYSSLISCEKINAVLRQKKLFFGKNLDVTSYVNGVRETHNPGGRANAPLVWDFYRNGCSVRILNPQTFFKKVHYLNAELQEYFGCFVGANVYLTPPGTQGFAPHYDDIEAFVMQIEGKKKWKLYAPVTKDDILPRVSSKNFTEDELGPMIMEVILEPGDLLYFPRGTVHQASALEDSHSLHITLSVYQKNSYADLLEKLLPAALSIAIEKNSAFRAGLPLHYLRHMGTAHSLLESDVRTNMLHTVEKLMKKLIDYAPVDAACDQMGKEFMIDALPPYLSKEERSLTVYGDGEVIDNKGVVSNTAEMEPDTRIRLLRYNAVRLVAEEDKVRLYYTVDNSKEYHGEEPQFLEIEESMAEGIEVLIHTYPNFIAVEELPMNDYESRQLATILWETGLLITEDPIGYMSD